MSATRPAGLNERRCIVRDSLGLYGSIVTLATYSTASSSEESLKGDIVKAVKECISVHAVLGTVVQDAETEHPSLVKVSDIDLNSHIQWESTIDSTEDATTSLSALLEKIHNEPWSKPATHPQWRLHIAQLPAEKGSKHYRLHAAFATSHSLVDGMSGLAFHTTFLEALDNASNLSYDAEPSLHLEPDQNPLLPPLDLAGHFPISWKFLLGPLIGHFLPAPIARLFGIKPQEDHLWYGAATRPQLPAATAAAAPTLLPTAVHTALLPAEPLRAVLQACRQHDARLTGLLNALAARALAATLHARRGDGAQQQQQPQPQVFAIETAIDLRRCLPVAKAHMANYTSAVTDTVAIDDAAAKPAGASSGDASVSAEDWAAAHRITTHLAAASSTLADQPVALLKYLGNYREWTAGKAASAATASFSTSNLGGVAATAASASAPASASASASTTVEPKSESTTETQRRGMKTTAGPGPWRREQMLFSQSADGTGAPFNMNVASCADGPLAVVMSWWPGMLGVADERKFMAEVCGRLVVLLESLSTA